MVTVIANTGIQIFSQRVSVNFQEIRDKSYFRQFLDFDTYKLSLELAHHFTDDDVYVRKFDLLDKGFIKDCKVTKNWEEISTTTSDITLFNEPEVFTVNISSLFRGKSPIIEKFLNVWLPFPYFECNNIGQTIMGPCNWSRVKIIPVGDVLNNVADFDIVVALDTRTIYDDGNYSDEYKECPVFPNEFEKQKKFNACTDDFKIMEFCSPSSGTSTEWVDKYIMKIVHNTSNINDVQGDVKLFYLAAYMYFVRIIAKYAGLPEIILYKDRNVDKVVNIDLVVDIGNSKTTALLVEESDFTRTRMLRMRNFTEPQKFSDEPFDMNVAFQKADFGDFDIFNSKQFVFPSFIRLGEEARFLMYKACDGVLTQERLSVCSSPKRYLWDTKKRKREWEYVPLKDDAGSLENPIWIPGISEQLNGDGTLSETGSLGENAQYSRRSLMMFSFLEILAQANMQINSHGFRDDMGDIKSPRKISKIIITCPTAMSRVEQVSLRKAAEEAYVIMQRYSQSLGFDATYKEISKKIEIVPSVKSLKNHTDWTYDEASCSQFVFLCAELAKRYLNNCEDYFNLYGKVRNDLPGYNKKSLTIGSFDIGAGTSDLMISAYEYSSLGQTAIKPIPLFWESFYIAGDDMLKTFVQQIVIEGPFAAISSKLLEMNNPNRTKLLADFFGDDTARMTFKQRLRRRDFNLQISVPIALRYIETARQQVKSITFKWDDFFEELKPQQWLLDSFYEHFGFRIEELSWKFDEKQIGQLIVTQFDDLIKKVSGAMAKYQCDIIVLSGRPTALKQIGDLFLKYYPVSPNRLKVLNNYRVGRWYPFQNGDGYFSSQKSIVSTGALLGYIASTQGGFFGLTLDLSVMQEKLLPTTDYFGVMNPATNTMDNSFITPQVNTATITANDLPLKIGTRQLPTNSYPVRSFFKLDFNISGIEKALKNKGILLNADIAEKTDEIIKDIRKRMPLTVTLLREDYVFDKEDMVVDSITDNDGNEISTNYVNLQIQSLSENEDFWLDSGAFKLSITTF